MAERIITLVRHGKYDNTRQTSSGGDLIAAGWEQAEHVARALDRPFPVTSIYSSTLQRAVTTARIVSDCLPNHIPFKQDKVLCEAVFHVPRHGSAYSDIPPATVASHRVRMAYAYKHYVRPACGTENEHDVLVCHGNVIRYFIVRAMRAPIELWAQMDIYHGSFTRLLVEANGNVRLVTHNEVSHLPRRLWTVA